MPKIETHKDSSGTPFDEYRLWLPPRVADWPTPPRTKTDTEELQAEFHREFAGKKCWLCTEKGHELHHLGAGMKGRSHDRYLFTWLCRSCHANIRLDDLGRLLAAKWLHDRAHVDWVRTAIRLGRHLPDLHWD